MTIQTFISKAIEGGWDGHCVMVNGSIHPATGNKASCHISSRPADTIPGMLLDPKAWEAVGKVEGWDEDHVFKFFKFYDNEKEQTIPSWQYYMLKLVDHLCAGGTITSFLKDL